MQEFIQRISEALVSPEAMFVPAPLHQRAAPNKYVLVVGAGGRDGLKIETGSAQRALQDGLISAARNARPRL